MVTAQLQLPPHYDARNSNDPNFHVANANQLQASAQEWSRKNGIKPVGSDRKTIQLLLIDEQGDFNWNTGSLYVAGQSGTGAMDDSARVAEFVYKNLGHITGITPTLDSHHPFQVFFSCVHLKQDGTSPDPFTVISGDDYRNGTYHVNPAWAKYLSLDYQWLQDYVTYYADQVEKTRSPLTIWPYHCRMGSNGHQLTGVIDEAIAFHGFARGAGNFPEVKGLSPLTEHYSIFQPEVQVTHDGRTIPGSEKNEKLIETLLRSNYVVVAGEAASHCLAWTIDDLLTHILANDKKLAEKVYIMRDCTSPVVIPGVIDYTPQMEAAFAKFEDAGMHLVNSTDPIDEWPGVTL